MFIAILTYKKPLEYVDSFLQAHRDYLAEHYAAGDFIMSGPQIPRVGGVIMIKAGNRNDVDAIIAQDPFNINGIADYQIVEFTPTMCCNDCFEVMKKNHSINDFEAKNAIVFRKATEEDIPVVAAILKAAVERMLSEGKQQWDHSYPNENHVRADVANGNGYVLICNNRIVAYGAVIFDGEPAYNSIRGKWLADEPYVVVHRMAVLPTSQKKGYGMSFLKAVEKLALSKEIKNFRIDTNHDNIRMLNLLKKVGFSCCGEICYQEGSRIAYAKRL